MYYLSRVGNNFSLVGFCKQLTQGTPNHALLYQLTRSLWTLQAYSRRMPELFFISRGPWVNIARVLVPLSLCDLAAAHMIKAYSCEDVVKQTLGGTK